MNAAPQGPQHIRPRQSGLDRALLLAATGGGVGYAPVAPGSVGSLWGPLMMFGWQQTGWPLWTSLLLAAALFAVGVPLCHRAAALLNAKDPGCVVFDEIAAFPLVFAAVEVTWLSAIVGFVWFRLFDVVKPWPCRRLEQLPDGWGVMADDAMAGVYAAAALWGTMWAVT